MGGMVRHGPAARAPGWPGGAVVGSRLGTRVVEGNDNHGVFVEAARCPHCRQPVIAMFATERQSTWFVWPDGVRRQDVSTLVPASIAKVFREAVLVLPASPTASAALSRRCLQHLLREQGHAQHDLVVQIAAALPGLPRGLQADLDLVRVVGNFAAHPIKGTQPDTLVDVEDGEAEWAIEVVEELFDHYYVRPAESSHRKARVNAMLTAAGRKTLP